MGRNRFGVWNDYGRLREVAVGTIKGARVPGWLPRHQYIREDLQNLLRRHAGRPAAEVDDLKELCDKAQGQLDNLAAVYEEFGVKVHRPRPLSDAEFDFLSSQQAGGMMIFPADPIWIIGRHAIECQFLEPRRSREIFPLRELIMPMVEADDDARIVSCPMSAPGENELWSGPHLEGGDIFMCGNDEKDVLVGIDEMRSSDAAGVEWLRRYLADDGYEVTGVPINQEAPIHLLGSLGVVGPKRALIYRPSFINDIPEQLQGWDLIDVTKEEVHATAPCVMMIDPETVLVPAETPRIAAELTKQGLRVVPVEVSALALMDGGIRSATFVMKRDA